MSIEISGVGEFWSSDGSDTGRYHGLLQREHSLESERWVLQIQHPLDGKRNTIQNMLNRFHLSHNVFGYVRGEPVTLIDCRHRNVIHRSKYSEYQYSPRYIVFGSHLPNASEFPIFQIEFSIQNLAAFTDSRNSALELETRDFGTISVNHDPSRHIWDVNDLQIQLRLDLNASTQGSTTTLERFGVFNIESQNGLRIQDWEQKVLIPLKEMISFASSQVTELEGLGIWFDESKFDELIGQTLTTRVMRNVILNRQPLPAFANNAPDWILRAHDCEDQNILHFLQPNAPVQILKNKLNVIRNSQLDQDETLIQHARLIESFHRSIHPVAMPDIEEYQQRVDSIIDLIGEHLEHEINLVSRRLRHGYEPSLENRIRQLAEPWKEDLVKLLGSKKNLNILASAIAHHRNYLAHGIQGEQRPLETWELRSANMFLRTLGQLCVFHNTGFSPEKAWSLIRRSPEWQEWADYLEDIDDRLL